MLKIIMRLSLVVALIWTGATVVQRESAPEAAHVAVANAYACPSIAMMASYLDNGVSLETRFCGPVDWSVADTVVSLGRFVMPYADVFDEFGEGVPLDTFVEVFRLKYQGVELIAIHDFYDYHAMDELPVGLKPGVRYLVWQDSPLTGSVNPQG